MGGWMLIRPGVVGVCLALPAEVEDLCRIHPRLRDLNPGLHMH